MNFMKLRYRGRPPYVPPPEPSLFTEIWPADDWDGTPGSSAEPAPTQPEITTAAPVADKTFSAYETVFEDGEIFCVNARVSQEWDAGEITCEAYCAGRWTELTARTFDVRTRVRGGDRERYGWLFTPKASAALAIATGQADVYFRFTPSNPALQPTVIGPYIFNFRPTEYDTLIRVAVTPGFSGASSGYAASNSIKLAFDYAVSHLDELVHIELIEDAEYDVDRPAAVTQLPQKLVIKRAAGCTATLGNGTRAQASDWRIHPIELRGLELPWSRMSTRLSWLIYIPNGGVCTFRDCEFYVGSASATGQTGSGASMLSYGRRPELSWLGNNANALYEFIDNDLHDMPEYAFASATLCVGNTLDTMSGTAAEGLRGYFGWNRITNLSAVDADYRTYKHAIDITGPANSWIEKVGLNGAAGALNSFEDAHNITASISGTAMTVTALAPGVTIVAGQYLRGSGVSSGLRIVSQSSGSAGGAGVYVVSSSVTLSSRTLYPSTHSIALSKTIPTNTQVTDVATAINAWGGSWAATADEANTRDATYLVLNGGTPASGFSPVSVGAGLALHTIIDSHTNFVAVVNVNRSNILIEFNEVPSVVTSGSFAMGDSAQQHGGIAFCNNIVRDVSADQGALVQQGRLNSKITRCFIEDNTFLGVGLQFLSGFGATGAYNSVSGNVFQQLTAPGVNDPDMIIRRNFVYMAGSFPTAADDSNVNLGASATPVDFLAEPANEDIRVAAQPIESGEVEVEGGFYAGARLPAALHTEENRGWKLPA